MSLQERRARRSILAGEFLRRSRDGSTSMFWPHISLDQVSAFGRIELYRSVETADFRPSVSP